VNFLDKIKYRNLISKIKIKLEELNVDYVDIEILYNIVTPHKEIIFNYFKHYFDFVYEHKEGQITTQEDFGKYLRDLLLKEKLSILEFGTWNGLGSTKIIFDNPTIAHSIEINPFIYSIAKKNLLPIKKEHKLILGKIIDTGNTKIDLKESYFSNEFNEKRNQVDMWLGSLVHIIFTCEADLIIDSLDEYYDVLLIDGGVLTTYDEFLIINERIKKYIFLDDLNGSKGIKIFNYLSKNSNYEIVFESKTRKACVFKKN
jgi:hypothetical protein